MPDRLRYSSDREAVEDHAREFLEDPGLGSSTRQRRLVELLEYWYRQGVIDEVNRHYDI